MNLIQIFLAALFKPNRATWILQKRLGKVLLYILGLGIILSIPDMLQTVRTVHDYQIEANKIMQKLPDFTIKKGQLTTDNDVKGFVYQSDTCIFTFDPKGKRTTEDVRKDTLNNVISIALLKNKLVLSAPDNELIESFAGKDYVSIPYKKSQLFKNFKRSDFKSLVDTTDKQFLLETLIYLFAILWPILVDLIFVLLITTFIVNLYSRLSLYPYRFRDNFRLITVAATIPVVLMTIVQLISPQEPHSFFIGFFALLLYTQLIKTIPMFKIK